VSTVVIDHGAWAARPPMDDTFRRQWAIQLARERAEQARIPTSSFDDEVAEAVERRPLERSRWLGLQIRSLLALVAVAEEGSFVRAATRLGYSRSTISHQIAQLEAAIGVSLVVRGSGSRSVTVTPAGRVVVAHGRAVLRLLENAESQLGELARREHRRRTPAPALWDPVAPPRPAAG
jgi:molybdenum-dependent DNA-binding transcriptional regulator ModE